MDENKCPQCGSKMKKDAKFCIFCGYINYDAPGNEDFRNLVVEKKVHKQIEFFIPKSPNIYPAWFLLHPNP